MKFIIYTLLFLLFSSNCYSLKFSFLAKSFKMDSLSSYYAACEYTSFLNNKEYLIRSNPDIPSLDFIDLEKQEFDFRVKIPFYAEAFYVRSLDSIFVIENETNTITLLDRNGNILKSIDFKDKLANTNDKYMVYASNERLMQLSDDRFIFNIVASKIVPKYYNYPTIGIYDYKTDDSIKKFAVFPESVRNGDVWMSYYPSYCLTDKNEIVCSYEVDHNLYCFDKNGNQIQTVEVKSKYINSFSPIDKTKQFNRKYSIEYQTTREWYAALFFDKSRNLYFRFAVHRQEYIGSDGMVKEFGSNPWSIIILDKDFKIIDEIFMEANKYYFNGCYMSSKGLMIRKNTEEIDEYQFQYVLLNIEENK